MVNESMDQGATVLWVLNLLSTLLTNKDDFVFFSPFINSINHRLDYQKYNVSLFLHSMSVYIGRYNITTDDAPRSFTAADNDE